MMTVSFMKMHYGKLPTKVSNYRNYKKFCNRSFLNYLKDVFSNRIPNEEYGRKIFLAHAQKFSRNTRPAKNVHTKQSDSFYPETSPKRLRRDKS